MVVIETCLQECPVNAGVFQGSILVRTFFLLNINDLPVDVICNTATYADDGTLTLRAIGLQIYDGKRSSWLPNPNLTYEILLTGVGSGLSVPILENLT